MIDTREELINALTEAAELEHGLLCQYIFAALTMRKRPEEGLQWKQVEMIRQWEGTILKVAQQEMAHLGTVCNILIAVGGAPHIRRPNFPQPARYYPPGIEFSLQRFGDAALERFIEFERPEVEPAVLGDIAPDPLTYTRVGDLYNQIKTAITVIDEQSLFVGSATTQDQDDWTNGLRLSKVTDRPSALQAIDFIIEDGEGTPEHREHSHYASFRRIREALAAEIACHRQFDPARPVINNPLTRAHRDAPGGNIITHPDTLEIAELFNVIYNTMLLMLMQFYTFGNESPEQRAGLQAAIRQTMSSVIRPLGEILTTLPAGNTFLGQNAGPGFEIYDDLSLPTSARIAWTVLVERLSQIVNDSNRLRQKPAAPARLDFIYQNLNVLTRNMQDLMKLKELS